MTWLHYFAYGSNMDRAGMAGRCPGARVVGPAALPGHRFAINRHGLATVVRAGGSQVHGLLWEITARHEASLDVYEAVAGGLYLKRQARPGLAGRGATRPALLYVAAERRPGPPRPGYLEIILEAAEALALPEAYRAELRALLPE